MLTYGEVLQDNQEGRFLRSEEILRHIAERCETILKELRDEQPEAKLVLFLSEHCDWGLLGNYCSATDSCTKSDIIGSCLDV